MHNDHSFRSVSANYDNGGSQYLRSPHTFLKYYFDKKRFDSEHNRAFYVDMVCTRLVATGVYLVHLGISHVKKT